MNSGTTGQVGGFQNRRVCLQEFPSFLPQPLPAVLPALSLATFFARSLTLVPHSLLLNCTKRLLRRLGLDLGAKPLRIRLYGVGCPVPLGGCFLLGGSRISCRSFHCLRSFPLSLLPRHQSPCWHSLCITEIFPYKKEANSRISTKQPNQQTKQLSFTIFLY